MSGLLKIIRAIAHAVAYLLVSRKFDLRMQIELSAVNLNLTEEQKSKLTEVINTDIQKIDALLKEISEEDITNGKS